MAYIIAEPCIGTKDTACPVTAIFPLDDLPEKWHALTEINKNYVDGGKLQPDKYQNVSS